MKKVSRGMVLLVGVAGAIAACSDGSVGSSTSSGGIASSSGGGSSTSSSSGGGSSSGGSSTSSSSSGGSSSGGRMDAGVDAGPKCTTTSCSGNGTCADTSGAVVCTCNAGYAGATCSTCAAGYQDQDNNKTCTLACAATTCSMHGTCADTTGTTVCTCDPGYNGASCSACATGFQDKDNDKVCKPECSANTCNTHGACDDNSGTATCACDPGYAGATCNACAAGYQDNDANGSCSLSCAGNNCSGNGTCSDTSGTATCTCNAGYEGADCSGNINECAVNPCQNGGTCVDGVNSYTCTCTLGYTGATCTDRFASCFALKTANPTAPDGDYVIDPDGAGALPAITVTCDMTTDGGGYTYYRVTGGIATTRFDQPNSCTAIGLKMVIPRTKAHLDRLWALYGAAGYMQTVPGVYGKAAGNYTTCAMNSSTACGTNWVALDGGRWFARGVTFGEPNGDYTAGTWLGGYGTSYDANGMFFNDLTAGYSTGPNYVCSDNAKP